MTALLSLLLAHAPAWSAQERDLAWYQEHGVTITTLDRASPMSFIGYDNKPKGFVIDIWNIWSRKTGIPVRYELTEWKVTLPAVRSGAIDIHGGLFHNDERAEYLGFSVPFFVMQGALVVSKEYDTDLKTIYNDYPLGILNDGYAEYFLTKHHPESTLVRGANLGELAQLLSEGRVKALVGDHPIMGFEVGRMGGGKEIRLKEVLYEQALRAGVAKSNTTLLAIVDKGLAMITENEMAQIKDRWFIAEVSTTDWVKDVLIVLAMLAVGAVIWLVLDRRKTGLGAANK